MKRFPKIRFGFIALFALSAVAIAAVACGEASDDASVSDGFQEEQGGGGNATIAAGGDLAESSFDGAAGEPGLPGRAEGISPPAAQPTTIPFPTSTPGAAPSGPSSDSDNPSPPLTPLEQQQPQVGSERVIVRNVDMTVEVNEPAQIVAEVSRIAAREGGWVVQSQNIEVHRGSVDIRVPANRLESVLAELRALATNVVSEVSTSQDFTEEFTDISARIRTLQDTVDSLRALFDRAVEIEDALAIQQEITRIQSDIESMQARVNFLSQSSAFSLIRLSVLALPQTMDINAGQDVLAAVDRSIRFRTEFTPPEGIENFRIEWDFGDGTGRQLVTAVAPVDTEGRVISAPVVHSYRDDTDSPYIVKVTVTGTGTSGAAEGEDVMIVTVNRVPPIQVFAGENRVVEEGKKITLRGTYTRPEGVESVRYTWDFGDGSAPVTIAAEPGETVAEIDHVYANSRSARYDVVLTVRGETEAGSTEGVDFLQVLVEEPESLTAGGFAPGDSGRSAFRALTAIGSGLATVGIWLGVLSPLWLGFAIVAFVVYRNRNREMMRRTSERLAGAVRQEKQADSDDSRP